MINLQDPAKRKKFYTFLTYAFAVGGFVWFVGIFVSVPHPYIKYTLYALLNWAIAWYCKQMSTVG